MAYSRVQTKNNVGAGTSLAITLDSAPTNGNVLVVIIGTTGVTTGRVSSISQTGVTWARVTQVANGGGVETETWQGTGISSGNATLTINLAASLTVGAVVAEYQGVPPGHAADKTATNTGSTTAIDSGTTATTTIATELWVGGGATVGAAGLSGSSSDGFTRVGSTTISAGFIVVMGEKFVSAVAAAHVSVSFSPAIDSEVWAGNISTFGGSRPNRLALKGVA